MQRNGHLSDFDLELLDEDLDIGGNLPSSRDRRSGSGVRTGHDPDSPEVKAKVVKMEHALAGRFKEFGLSEGGTFPKCLDEDKMDLSFEDSNSMESVSHPFRSMDAVSPDGMGGNKSRKNKEDKYCGVCGDRALGYNFDAISCESCKAFFRRNAPKGLEYFKCPYEEKCKMDVSNRRFCKRCRLRKCFEIGMRKEYILTEEEKMRKRARIEENRDNSGMGHGQFGKKIKSREVERTKTQSGDVSSSQHRLRPLEAEEMVHINELVGAYRQSLEICVESEISRDKPSMTDLVNIAEVSVRRVIDMAKKIKSFKALSQPDQISLLKGGSIELLIIRSVITFDKDKGHFLDPFDKDKYAMTTEQLKMGEGGGLFDEHMKFVKSLAMDLHADETILILLLVIALFSPDRPNISDKNYVAQEQDKYALLLQRYLESKFSCHVVRCLYPKLLMKLTDIRNLNEEHSQVLLKVNPEGIQPLMKEVLDLNLTKDGQKVVVPVPQI
ncbi:nuclear hormone receptor HR96-like isoform X2 [Haliotis rubra]|uniref:nuclear hormone receptor HR96-like isoform X2 n=1 Tax=Haliotis rubra TaxID=36100 RepID=UPI001EE5D0D6|nr:nuclear hormone receptor HR96-like isoform X2 [Haliotis rubra]